MDKERETEGRRRDKQEPHTRAWSMEDTQAYWIQGSKCQPQDRMSGEAWEGLLGPGFEYHFKDLGASELPKGFRTGNDMIRCEM